MVGVSIGDKIRIARAAKRMSQGDLAAKADCSRVTIMKIENGHTKNMSVKTAMKIADALGLSVDFLLCSER